MAGRLDRRIHGDRRAAHRSHRAPPEDAFHFVAPSLPGFGFSDKPAARGWNADRIATAWGESMGRLGYTRYVAQGGDWGAFVTTRMAQLHVPGLAAIHITMPQVIPDKLLRWLLAIVQSYGLKVTLKSGGIV